MGLSAKTRIQPHIDLIIKNMILTQLRFISLENTHDNLTMLYKNWFTPPDRPTGYYTKQPKKSVEALQSLLLFDRSRTTECVPFSAGRVCHRFLCVFI